MKMIKNNTYVRNDLLKDKVTFQFISNTLKNLEDEINTCNNNFSIKPGQNSGLYFMCTEMSWIGLLISSIKKSYPEASMLPELTLYGVSLLKTLFHVGRPDLLVSFKTYDETSTPRKEVMSSFLIEAKLYEFKKRKSYSNHEKKVFEKTYAQIQTYEKCLKENMGNYNPTKISIVFEWIRDEENLKIAEERFHDLCTNPNTNSESQFSALFSFEDKGVLIYGKVF